MLWALPQGPWLQHKHVHVHGVTVSQHVTVCVCLGLTGATQRWCKRASDEPRISCQGCDALLSSPLIASTPICLMSEKTCIRGHESHIQYSRCTQCDTHTQMPTITPRVFLPLSLSNTFTHTDKLWFISTVRAHTHMNTIMNPSLTTHTGSAGRIDSNQQD